MREPGTKPGSAQQEARTCPVCGTKFFAIKKFIGGRSVAAGALSIEGPAKDELRRTIVFSSSSSQPMVDQCRFSDSAPGNNCNNTADGEFCPVADQFGWKEMVATVAKVYNAYPPTSEQRPLSLRRITAKPERSTYSAIATDYRRPSAAIRTTFSGDPASLPEKASSSCKAEKRNSRNASSVAVDGVRMELDILSEHECARLLLCAPTECLAQLRAINPGDSDPEQLTARG